jgi:predicted alpha/beta-hydrolase family hydrolase
MADLIQAPGIYGWLHRPAKTAIGAIGITHGAGSNCQSPLLIGVADAFAERGFAALRYNLPYRQARPQGPPSGKAAQDREGVRQVARWLQEQFPGPLYLSGHSYGGRQTSMAAAEDPALCHTLLLLSYPLHPPKQQEKLRTEHFPALRLPVLFVHGTKDEFGTVAELKQACTATPARTHIQALEGNGHSLNPKYASQIAEWFDTFTREC